MSLTLKEIAMHEEVFIFLRLYFSYVNKSVSLSHYSYSIFDCAKGYMRLRNLFTEVARDTSQYVLAKILNTDLPTFTSEKL